MRRSAQFVLLRGQQRSLTIADVDAALEEIVFLGGALNLKLLGADAGWVSVSSIDSKTCHSID